MRSGAFRVGRGGDSAVLEAPSAPAVIFFENSIYGIQPMSSRTIDAKPARGSLAYITQGSVFWWVAMPFRAVLLSGSVSVLIVACGASATPPKLAERPDVIITLDGKRHACVVALDKEPQGSTVPCKEAVSFVKGELRVPGGSIYDIHTVANVDNAEIVSVRDALNGAGYRFIGGRKIP
jgi:hypothetical protein